MARDCDYHRPSDGAPCVMGAMHVTKHYFAEVEPAAPEAEPPALAPGGPGGPAGEGDALPGSQGSSRRES